MVLTDLVVAEVKVEQVMTVDKELQGQGGEGRGGEGG